MKILTVRQPWAALILSGGKDIENRTWSTRVRGRIGIHASAKLDKRDIWDACELMREFVPNFSPSDFADNRHVTGAIIGTVEIVDCVVRSESPWFCGPYGFVLRNPVLLPEPIRVHGQLGFWEYGVVDPWERAA